IRRNSTLGFTAQQDAGHDYEQMKDKVLNELKKSFRPEFLNRIDETIVFHPLSEEHIERIVALMAEDLRKRLKEQDVEFELTDAALKFLAKEGYDPQYGARPLRRAIQKHIEDRLSEDLLLGKIHKGDKVVIDESEGELIVRKASEVAT